MSYQAYFLSIAFLLITLALGGGAAWLTGRAIALSWRPIGVAMAAAFGLAGGVRFLHYALAHEPLLAADLALIDTMILMAMAAGAWQRTRALQMVRQYPWLYVSAGPFNWRPRSPDNKGSASGVFETSSPPRPGQALRP
jgi:hypothetical protein